MKGRKKKRRRREEREERGQEGRPWGNGGARLCSLDPWREVKRNLKQQVSTTLGGTLL